MKPLRFTRLCLLAFAVLALPLAAVSANAQDPQAQNQSSALMRGYRTGYSDGYQAGVSDVANNGSRDFRAKSEYERGDRGYNSTHGALEDYRDGYQQGFESGYAAGFDHQPFDSSIPQDLRRRDQSDTTATNVPVDPNNTRPTPVPVAGGVGITRDTIMRIELLNNISTDASHKGDSFEARVIEPKEYEGATIQGRVVQVTRAGKVKGTAQLQLAFDEIRMPDGRSAKMSAQVIEVIRNGGSEGVGKVDQEVGVQGQGSTGRDVQKVGTAAGIGAVIGAIAGGGVGAAVGATIGAGVGTAGVMTERGRDIRLYHGQQLRIRTSGDTAIQ